MGENNMWWVGYREGLCPDREDHLPHEYTSPTLGDYWCTADQDKREPNRSERRRAA